MSVDGRICACTDECFDSLNPPPGSGLLSGGSSYFRWKGVLDRLTAAVLLLPGLPLMGLLIVLVRLTSRGPGIYSQVRVGKDGRQFTMYKLRSMRQDAEVATGAVWTTAKDPRITPLGLFLRKTHLDELPQLLNVLKGEMSLIGPRPERPEFVRVLEQQIAGYRHRLAVAPGVTGLAQINLPPDSDLDSVRRKQCLDLLYIDTASLWLDGKILLCTLLRMFGCRGTFAARALGVHRQVELPQTVEQREERETGIEVAATPSRLVDQASRQTLTWGDTVEMLPLRLKQRRAAENAAPQDASSLAPVPTRQIVPKPR